MLLAIIFDSVGAGEWFVLLAVLLVVMGPRRLPSAARQFGSFYSKFRRAAENFRRQLLEMDTELEREVNSLAGSPPPGFIPDTNPGTEPTPSEDAPAPIEEVSAPSEEVSAPSEEVSAPVNDSEPAAAVAPAVEPIPVENDDGDRAD